MIFSSMKNRSGFGVMLYKRLLNLTLFRTYSNAIDHCNSPPKCKFLKNLTKEEKIKFLDSFDTVFCDCDGVIWHMFGKAIQGSAEAIEFLRQKGKEITFITNQSRSTTKEIVNKFKRFNIQVTENEVLHPSQNVCDYLKSINFNDLIFCIASTNFKNTLRKAGFTLVEDETILIEENPEAFYSAVFTNNKVKAIVVDFDFNMTATKLSRAYTHLQDPECLLISGGVANVIPTDRGNIIGPGVYTNILEKLCNRKSIVLGKPGLELSHLLKSRRYELAQNSKRTLAIGDTLSSDIKFGKRCGFQTLLVLTGSTKLSDIECNLNANEMPDYVIDSLGELHRIL